MYSRRLALRAGMVASLIPFLRPKPSQAQEPSLLAMEEGSFPEELAQRHVDTSWATFFTEMREWMLSRPPGAPITGDDSFDAAVVFAAWAEKDGQDDGRMLGYGDGTVWLNYREGRVTWVWSPEAEDWVRLTQTSPMTSPTLLPSTEAEDYARGRRDGIAFAAQVILGNPEGAPPQRPTPHGRWVMYASRWVWVDLEHGRITHVAPLGSYEDPDVLMEVSELDGFILAPRGKDGKPLDVYLPGRGMTFPGTEYPGTS